MNRTTEITTRATAVKHTQREWSKDDATRGAREARIAATAHFGMMLDGMMSESEFAEMVDHAQQSMWADLKPNASKAALKVYTAKRYYGMTYLETIESLIRTLENA
jgi:hypothetical protein